MLCCILAALAASPLLWWQRGRRPAGPGVAGRGQPLLVAGLVLTASAAALCLVLFTTPGAAAFRHICSTAAWIGGSN